MSMFADYEEEVTECLEKCKEANAATSASNISEAKDLIQQMKLEMRTMQSSEKIEAATTIQKLESMIQEAESEALMGGAADGSAEQSKVRADAAINKLEKGSERLARTKLLVAEMEETGSDIVGTLAENREKIASAHDKVRVAKGELDKADKITTRMGKWWANW